MAQLLVPALASVFGGGVLATAVSQIAVGLALSYASQALFSKDAPGVEPATQTSRTNGTIAPQRILLGKVKTAGHDMFPAYCHDSLGQAVGSENSGKYLTLGIALSDLPIDDLVSVTLQDLEFRLGTELVDNSHQLGYEIASGLGDEFSRYEGKMWVRFYDGTQTVADPYMRTVFASHPDRPYTADMIYQSGAYALLTVEYDQELWTNLNDVGWVCRGMLLNSAFTSNPIELCNAIASGITLPSGDIYGPQMPIDSGYLAPAITASNDAGFEAGLEVQIGTPDGEGLTSLDAMERLLEACAGRAWDDGGTLKATALDGGLPLAHITDDTILKTKGRTAEKSGSLKDRTNSVTITYPDSARLWALNPAQTHTDTDAVTADGERLPVALTYPAVFTENQAQVLSGMLVADAQRVRVHTFALPLAYGTLTVQDKITWTSGLHSYDTKVFRVESITRMPTYTLVTVRETDPDDFDPDLVTLIPSTPAVFTPTGPDPLSSSALFVAATQEYNNGNIRAGVRIISTETPASVTSLRWRIRVVGEAEIISGSFDPNQLSAFVPLSPSVQYEGSAMFVAPARTTPWGGWQAFTTPDVRLSLPELGDDVATIIAAAQATADAASTGVAGNAAAVATVQNNLNTQVATLSGDIDAAVSAVTLAYQSFSSVGPSLLDDPLFDRRGVDRWTDNGAGTPSAVVDNALYETGKTIQFNAATNTTQGVALLNSSGWVGQQDADYYVIEVDFTLVSGTLQGAGVVLDWDATTTDGRTEIALEDMLREPADFNRPFRAQALIPRASFTGTFTGHDLFLMANFGFSGHTLDAKEIHFHRCSVRLATDEELGLGAVNDAITASVATEAAARATDVAALTTTQTTQQSSIASLSATVNTQGATLATVDGVVQAMTGLTAEVSTYGNTDYVSGLLLTSYANPDGSGGSAISLWADDILAFGSLSADKFTSGIGGGNQVEDSRFQLGTFAWLQTGTGDVETDTTFSVNDPGDDWAGPDYPTLSLSQPTTTTTGYKRILSRRLNVDGTFSNNMMPVEEGGYYGFGAKISTHRCSGRLVIIWRDENGAAISPAVFSAVGVDQSDILNPDNWPNYWVQGQAPVGAVYAQVGVDKFGTDSPHATSFLFLHKPYTAVSHANAVRGPGWAPEGVSVMHGGRISTGTITAENAVFANGAIQTADIGDLQVDTLKIAGRAVTQPAFAENNTALTIDSAVWVDLVSITEVNDGFETWLDFSCQVEGDQVLEEAARIEIRFLRNGVDISLNRPFSSGHAGKRVSQIERKVDTNLTAETVTHKVQGRLFSDGFYPADALVIGMYLSAQQFKR